MNAKDYFNYINSITTTISNNLKYSSFKENDTVNQIGPNTNNVVVTNSFIINQNILLSVTVVSSLLVVVFGGIILYIKKEVQFLIII
jgi:hypothetical protein